MKKNSWHLDKRTFLKGSGIALALPFMNAMAVGAEEKSCKVFAKKSSVHIFPEWFKLASRER